MVWPEVQVVNAHRLPRRTPTKRALRCRLLQGAEEVVWVELVRCPCVKLGTQLGDSVTAVRVLPAGGGTAWGRPPVRACHAEWSVELMEVARLPRRS